MNDEINGYSIWNPTRSKNTDKVTAANPNNMPVQALEYQENKAKEILSCCVPRNAINNSKKVGLVVGKVQSGKTTSFTYLTSLAADNGYKIIIHLLGTTTNLKNDNAKSVKEILCSEDDTNYWRAIDVVSGPKIDPSTETLEQILYEETNPDLDFLPEQDETVVYFYLLKNHVAIKKMKDYMVEYHSNLNSDRGPLPVLIVDDEVDSYSPDASKKDEDATTTHKELEELYNSCPIVSYVGYTATSQAIAYAEESNFLNPDFVCLLEPGEDYDGNIHLFGDKLERIEGVGQNDTANVMEIDIPDIDGEDDEEERADSLHEAIRYYLVSSILYFGRSLKRKHTTMMVHGNLKVDIHKTDARFVKACLEDIENHFDEDSENGNTNLASQLFRPIYDEVFNKKIDSISFDDLIKRIRAVIQGKKIKTIVVNASKECGNERIPEIKWKDSHLWIVVGGHGLSRGYVVSGLITTWMPRQAQKLTADTLEQMGRFFGYHKGYSDLIRVFLKRESIEAFKAYDTFEKSVWDALATCINDGTRIFDATLTLELPQELHYPTSTTKMKRDDTSNRFLWASTAFSPFTIQHNDIVMNNNFHSTIKNYIEDLQINNVMSQISKDSYKSIFETYSGDQYLFNCYKVAENLDLHNVMNDFIEPLGTSISDNDIEFNEIIRIMKNDSNQKCDIVLIKHPGRGNNPSTRRIRFDDSCSEYKMNDIQQGPNTRTSFKGDKEVSINEPNYQIQVICYDGANINGDAIDNISDLRVISIMKPNREEVSTINLN